MTIGTRRSWNFETMSSTKIVNSMIESSKKMRISSWTKNSQARKTKTPTTRSLNSARNWSWKILSLTRSSISNLRRMNFRRS